MRERETERASESQRGGETIRESKRRRERDRQTDRQTDREFFLDVVFPAFPDRRCWKLNECRAKIAFFSDITCWCLRKVSQSSISNDSTGENCVTHVQFSRKVY